MTQKHNDLPALATLLRAWILTMTTAAGSGHPTSSLSGVELMNTLFFGADGDVPFFRYTPQNPTDPYNDRLIFSKGHAAPLLYALWAAVGQINAEELMTLRQWDSRLEGHPTMRFPFTEAATGALGQGLSIGLGMALAQKRLDRTDARTWVLLGDSEMAEGQNWEAMELARYYNCDNLIAIVDINRLGQRGETMLGHDVATYAERAQSFGWHAIVVSDGHDTEAITRAYADAATHEGQPVMICARTIKGKGISFLEDHEGWHGRALTQKELKRALPELGEINYTSRGTLAAPRAQTSSAVVPAKADASPTVEEHEEYAASAMIAPRDAYGDGLVDAMRRDSRIIVLDAEVSNSTRASAAKKVFPERFFEMFIAEQNMVSVAVGLARRGYVPYVSSFAAFLTRAHGQLRMAPMSGVHMVCTGSHPGVSIGADGASQMGLEDIALFRAILGSVVLSPADAVSACTLTANVAECEGITYLRMVREKVPVLYAAHEEFPIGGSKTFRKSAGDKAVVIATGVTVHEALKAQKLLHKEGLPICVIDAYSIKPLDRATIRKAAADIQRVVVVEDHYAAGGLGEAVCAALDTTPVTLTHLAVRKTPHSGTAEELRAYEEIDATAIVRTVREMV